MSTKYLSFQAEKDALAFRHEFDLGTSDPINIESLLVKLNIITVFAKTSDAFSGMALKHNRDRFMLINCNHPKGRQHFTICHELYHLYIQEDFLFEANTDEKVNNQTEKLADFFSSELLMPLSGIKSILSSEKIVEKKISLDDVIKLEQYFQVSRQAILTRLKKLAFVSSAQYDRYADNPMLSAKIRGFDDSLYLPTSPRIFSNEYFDKAKKLYENDKIGVADYAQLMADIGIDIYELEETAEKV